MIITAIVSVAILYKVFTYGSETGFSSVSSSVSSWSKAHPLFEKDPHKDVIAGDTKVSDKVSEHTVAGHALDALPGALKGQASLETSKSPQLVSGLANAT